MGVTFEVDHITPASTGGKATLSNLCLSCPTCNRHNANRVTALDVLTEQHVPLYHPTRDQWDEHLTWTDGATLLVGVTPTGRATIAALQMNRPQLVQLRGYWVATGRHPAEVTKKR